MGVLMCPQYSTPVGGEYCWVLLTPIAETEPTVVTAVFVVHGLSLDNQQNTTIYNP